MVGYQGELDDAASAPIHIADRTWLLVVRDPNRPDVSLPLLLAVIGIALAALLGALILVWSRNERMQELEREASQDPLTGLKNRRRFEEDLRLAMARARRERTTGAMLMLDLDHFKQVNDTHGHPAGDQLLIEIAEVLRRRSRASDMPRAARRRRVRRRPAPLQPGRGAAGGRGDRERDPRAPARLAGVDPITASVGVAMFGDHPRTSISSVVSEADAAMYAAKDGGRDGVRVFDADSRARAGGPSSPSRDDPARRSRTRCADPLELLAVEGARAELGQQRPPGRFGRCRGGEQQQIGAGPHRRQPGLGRPAESPHGDRVEGVGDRDPLEAQAASQLSGCNGAGEGGGLGRQGRVDRGAEHHQLAPGRDEGPVGRLVVLAQGRRREVDPLHREVGVLRGRAEAGEVLRRGRDPALLQPGGEGDGGRGDPLCVAAEAALGRRRSCPRAGRGRGPGRGRR